MGISNTVVVILIIAAILVSVIGTYVVLDKANNIPVTRSGQGQIGVNVVNPQPGQIGVNVVNPEGGTEGE